MATQRVGEDDVLESYELFCLVKPLCYDCDVLLLKDRMTM